MPILTVFAGLPGTGKTTLARALCLASGATYLRVDTAEQALNREGDRPVGAAGYAVIQAIATDNLGLGRDVVVDGVNPVEASRQAFATCARAGGARLVDVEVVCSNRTEHRRRVEARRAETTSDNRTQPDWASVLAHRYEPWTTPRIVLDTATRSTGQAVALLLDQFDH